MHFCEKILTSCLSVKVQSKLSLIQFLKNALFIGKLAVAYGGSRHVYMYNTLGPFLHENKGTHFLGPYIHNLLVSSISGV
jgi:hypothetical protein